MAEGRLQRVRAELSALLEERVNKLMDGEPAPERLAELLGAVKAAERITLSIVATERDLRQRERRKDELRGNLNTATRDDANRIKEHIDEIQDRINQLSKQRETLTANLATLTDKLAT
ncbi:MAG: hypothetical protein JRI25_04055 [Deltaproteobacteria bacterium]|nr:hypothetical protein [Deltaproteobacteria bacterium]MBW2253753.1 hypothetical protein [Deltaproteobacteria bacterium]